MDQALVVNESDNVNKIRDILFGAQSRAFEIRLNDLEHRLLEGQNKLKAELQLQFEALKQSIQSTQAKQAEHKDAYAVVVNQLEKDVDAKMTASTALIKQLNHEHSLATAALKSELTQSNLQLEEVRSNSVKRETLSRLLGQLSKALGPQSGQAA